MIIEECENNNYGNASVRRPNSRLKTQVLSARFTSLFAVANTKETNKKTGTSNTIVIEN